MHISQATAMKLTGHMTCIMHALNERDLKKIKYQISQLKKLSTSLPSIIKDDIQTFIIQAEIQKDYDITHGTSKKLKELADQIIYDLKKFCI